MVLAPHTDDGELGCGATVARLLREGAYVTYVAYSSAAESLPAGMPPDQLVREVREATMRLGIPEEQLIVYDYQVRKLNYHRQDILESMVALRERLRPDLVFVPSRSDVHQDHGTVTAEALRAFKQLSILGYELPWNNLSFDADCFVAVAAEDVALKSRALAAYESQAGRAYMQPDFAESLARVRGTQVGVEFAECFEVIRLQL